MDTMAVTAIAMDIWEQLAFKFIPLIGLGGIRVIYARALEFNQLEFPWLPQVELLNVTESPFDALKTSLEHRQPAEVIMANSALLDTFINLLATMIGVRLLILFLRSTFPDDNFHQNTQES